MEEVGNTGKIVREKNDVHEEKLYQCEACKKIVIQ